MIPDDIRNKPLSKAALDANLQYIVAKIMTKQHEINNLEILGDKQFAEFTKISNV
jgi:hypothetical protein